MCNDDKECAKSVSCRVRSAAAATKAVAVEGGGAKEGGGTARWVVVSQVAGNS